jgi:5-methylcytosine-specific restriction endonuclease McrA
MCEGCGDEKAQEVHHKTYKNVGDEFLFELVALCNTCHDRYHKIEGEAEDVIRRDIIR